MKKPPSPVARYWRLLPKLGLTLLAAWGLCCEPAQATLYGWTGLASTNWTDAGSWGASGVAPTGGTFDAVITVTNKANSALYYTAANGSTLFTNVSSEGSGRALRIGDLSAGT